MGNRVWKIRDALANEDYDEAEVCCAELMAHVALQLEALDYDEDAALFLHRPKAGFVLDHDPLDGEDTLMGDLLRRTG